MDTILTIIILLILFGGFVRLLWIFSLRYGRRHWHTRHSPDHRRGAVRIWPGARIGTIAAYALAFGI